MTDPRNVHPLAPSPGTPQEGPGATENDPAAVNMRSGVQLGTMRYVLAFGLGLAIVAMVAAYMFGYLPAA